MKYREILYSNYHTTQSGRAALTDAKSLFERESWRFTNEIVPYLNNLDKDARILDIGCGSGSLIHALNRRGFNHTMGVDLSKEQVDLAHQFGVTSVQLGDVLEVLRDDSLAPFDLITGMDIIEHFTKDELVELLALIQKKLTPSGKAIFRTPNLDAPLATVYANGDFTHENFLNASSAQQVCLACGFKSVEVHESNMNIPSFLKELLRKVLWFIVKSILKFTLFATGRSTRNIVLSPNLVIIAKNHG